MKKPDWMFAHSRSEDADWTRGLRNIFDYRDLDIESATNGDYVAHVIRSNGTKTSDNVQQWHVHECNFQMIYVLNGWAKFEYEGQGEHKIVKGDCVLQPPLIRHREIACSVDFEVLEIVSPAGFSTRIVDQPE